MTTAYNFKARIKDSDNSECDKDLTLNVESPTGPDWTLLDWDDVEFLGWSATGGAGGDSFSFNLQGDPAGSSSSIVIIHGTIIYTGAAANCKLTLDLSSNAMNGSVYIVVMQDGNPVLVLNGGCDTFALGAVIHPFSLLAGVGSVIEVATSGSPAFGNLIAQASGFGPPTPAGHVAGSVTLSNI